MRRSLRRLGVSAPVLGLQPESGLDESGPPDHIPRLALIVMGDDRRCDGTDQRPILATQL